ncbi:MAG: hypothetical protein LBH20_09700 [Treponema sp.]|jgi:uncharacterized lipoprotein YehR (DUF1307 family)|nr:hypothetical protein [Treponema sp.]
MKNFAKFFGIITLAVVIGFSMAACGDGSNPDDGGEKLPPSSGTNEVEGKTLYLDWQKVVFAATGTTYTRCYDSDDEEPVTEGSYSYNSGDKTITIAIKYIYVDGTKMNKKQLKDLEGKKFDDEIAWIRSHFDDWVLEQAARELPAWDDFRDDYDNAGDGIDRDAFLKQWLTQKGYTPATLISQWKSKNSSMNTADKLINVMLAEAGYRSLAEARADSISWVDEEFALTTYEYQFTDDDALLVQQKLPANKGANELQGKTFTYTGDSGISYTFTASGYTRTNTYDTPAQITDTGAYAYDSAKKQVWFKPEKVYSWSSSSLETMLEYYESSAYGDTADRKAGDTNNQFWKNSENYGLTPINWIGYYEDYSIKLNRSIPNTLNQMR